MDVSTRRLQVRATNGHNKVCLLMAFPNVYPDKVPPHFYLLDDTTVDPVAKTGLAEVTYYTLSESIMSFNLFTGPPPGTRNSPVLKDICPNGTHSSMK